jgi:hypothetical protein
MDIDTIMDNWVKAEHATFNPQKTKNPNEVVPLGLTISQLYFLRETLKAHLQQLEPTSFVPAIRYHYDEVKVLLSYINQRLDSTAVDTKAPAPEIKTERWVNLEECPHCGKDTHYVGHCSSDDCPSNSKD